MLAAYQTRVRDDQTCWLARKGDRQSEDYHPSVATSCPWCLETVIHSDITQNLRPFGSFRASHNKYASLELCVAILFKTLESARFFSSLVFAVRSVVVTTAAIFCRTAWQHFIYRRTGGKLMLHGNSWPLFPQPSVLTSQPPLPLQGQKLVPKLVWHHFI